MNDRLCIYISSPDSYADVFSVFYRAYKKYWAKCPYEFILTTNTQKYDDINCICNNKHGDTWVERTRAAMSHIKSKYILLMCDDIILSDYVQVSNIEYILDRMEKDNIVYCRLKPLKSGKKLRGSNILYFVNKETAYAINLQICIIRKDYFVELLGDGTRSAWDIENQLNKISSQACDEYYENIISVEKPVIPFIHGVWKGKWIRKTHRYIKKEYPDYEFSRPMIPIVVDFKIKMIDFVEKNVSSKARRNLKNILSSLGVKFSTKN